MSVKAMNWAFSQDLQPAGVKLVLVALADGANYHGGDNMVIWLGQKNIAKMTSMSERAIRGHLRTLEEMGLISREERRRPDGMRTSDMITLNMGEDEPEKSPAEFAGDLLTVTGKFRQGHRQVSSGSPAKVAGVYKNRKENHKGNHSDTNVSDAGASPEDQFWSMVGDLKDHGMTDGQARGLMGRLLNNCSGDHDRALRVIETALTKRDARSYLAGAINQIRERNQREAEWRDDMAI